MSGSEKFWDRTAKSYDQEEQKDAATYTTIIEKLKQYLKPDDTVLDFGCGTGLIANEIAGRVKRIEALDTSANMIELARAKAAARGIQNIEYAQTSLSDSRYAPGTYDVIVAAYVLHLVDEAALPRIHALLKPGGMFVSVTPCMGEKKMLSAGLRLMSKVGLIPVMRSYTGAELEAEITAGHFEIVETARLHHQEDLIVAKKL